MIAFIIVGLFSFKNVEQKLVGRSAHYWILLFTGKLYLTLLQGKEIRTYWNIMSLVTYMQDRVDCSKHYCIDIIP